MQDASARTRAWIDLLGALLLLLPFAVAVICFSLPYVARSWAILNARARQVDYRWCFF
jgi:TRAP-type mannitol/chloroaromatic compound transport system permease small subunit